MQMLFCKRVLRILLPTLVVVSLFSCNKDSKEFTLVHNWRVESVSRAGVDVPADTAIGDNYDFRKNGKCYLTRKATGEVESHTWSSDDDLKVLYIDGFRYEIYTAAGNELIFGQVVDGKELFTYHTRQR